MSRSRLPAEVLTEARRRESRAKRQRVLAVVEQLVAQGERVTFAVVARQAGVSNWLVYADGVREHIEKARNHTTLPSGNDASGRAVATAGLRTDLELSRAEVRALRQERDKLRTALQRNLGHQLDHTAAKDLIERIDELTRQNQQLSSERDEATQRCQQLEQQLRDTEDDLAATRTNLRRMIRTQRPADEQAEVT